MRIIALRLRNYKAFKALNLEGLSGFSVFVGANGTGKSTLFDVMAFLRDALKNNVRQALLLRGGFHEVLSRGASGPIEIELQFMLSIGDKPRKVTYGLAIGWKDGAPLVEREFLRYKRGEYGSPFYFLKFENGKGYAIKNEQDFGQPDELLEREEQALDADDILAIKGLGQFRRFKAASALRQFIESWHVSDFHIAEARPSKDAAYADHLSPNGDNLPLFAQYLHERHPDIFRRAIEKMRQRVPGIVDAKAETTIDGRVVLTFRDGAFRDPFIARYVSDGTLKMFAYILLLHDPSPHPLLCVEEPENQLYPNLLHDLAEEFRAYGQAGGQVFVTTHSPDFLNAAKLEEVFWLVKKNGFTEVRAAATDPTLRALVAAGDGLGYLWQQGYFSESHA